MTRNKIVGLFLMAIPVISLIALGVYRFGVSEILANIALYLIAIILAILFTAGLFIFNDTINDEDWWI